MAAAKKGKSAKGTKKKPKAKAKATPKRRRRKKPEKRTPEELKADGGAVKEDLKAEQGEEGARPWDHLPEDNGTQALHDEEGKEVGRRSLTALEIVQRNSEIFRGWLRGLSPETLAQTYGLNPRSIREIVEEWKKEGSSVIGSDPMQIIEEHVLRLDAVVDELAAHSAREKGSGRTAAIRARLEAMKARIEFLQSVRLLPQDLGTIGLQLDLRAIGALLYEALEKRGLAEPSLMAELADIIEGKRQPGEIDPESGKAQLPAAA